MAENPDAGNPPQGEDFNEAYRRTFFSQPAEGGGGGEGRGPPTSRIIIFLVVYIVITALIFVILGPIGGAIAGLVGFFLFLMGSGLGHRIMKSKHFPAIVGMMLLVGIAVFVAYFYVVGGFQATSGLSYQTSQGFSSILQSGPLKQLMNFASNPFGLNPTSGQYEELPAAETPAAGPNQAFTIETRGFTSTVAFKQPALSFFIKVNNNGAQTIKQLDLSVDSGNRPGCIVFNNQYTNGDQKSPLKISVYDIPPSSSKEISVTGGYVDTNCMAKSVGLGTQWKANIPVDVFISVKGFTYYSTSSRLAVERIRSDYGSLLFQNGVLTQQPVGAIYQAGTALSINLDAGDQPILDTVSSVGLIMNWINNGAGTMPTDKSPFLFIVTPRSPYDFGPCAMNLGTGANVITDKGTALAGINVNITDPTNASRTTLAKYTCNDLNALIGKEGRVTCMLCDDAMYATWCSSAKSIYQTVIDPYSPAANSTFTWACNQWLNGKSHVCATNAMTEEFNVFNCNMNISNGQILTGENRHTDYITAIAVYPYQVSAPDVDVKAYCTESGASQCPS